MKPDLMAVHGKLAELAFAVKESIGRRILTTVTVEWHPTTYLQVRVECYAASVQMVADVLSHGALYGEYDYRFTAISRPNTEEMDPWEWVAVTATPNMAYDMNRSSSR